MAAWAGGRAPHWDGLGCGVCVGWVRSSSAWASSSRAWLVVWAGWLVGWAGAGLGPGGGLGELIGAEASFALRQLVQAAVTSVPMWALADGGHHEGLAGFGTSGSASHAWWGRLA